MTSGLTRRFSLIDDKQTSESGSGSRSGLFAAVCKHLLLAVAMTDSQYSYAV